MKDPFEELANEMAEQRAQEDRDIARAWPSKPSWLERVGMSIARWRLLMNPPTTTRSDEAYDRESLMPLDDGIER